MTSGHGMVREIVKQAVCLALSLAALVCLAPAAQTTELAGRTVSIAVVNTEDLSPANWTGGNVTMGVRPAQVLPTTNIYRLLEGNGVIPDTEAFAVVYELNPTLRDLRSTAPGTTVQLPRVAGDEVLAKLHHGGYLAMLTVDADLREALNRSAETLQQTAAAFAEVPNRSRSAAGGDLQGKVASLRQWYAQIRRSFLRRTGPPLRRDSLLQLRREANQLNSILEAGVNADGKLADADVRCIAAIHEDVELEMTNYGQELANEPPKADALYRVVVNISGTSAKGLERVRVYYINYGLFRDPPGKECDSFRTPGSGVSELMRVQNYMIWAAQDGDPGHPVTEPLRVKVRPWDGEPILVTLSAHGSLR
jgi:hypothetical protein